ncbi:hypothetical protein [Sandaracinus amylolyticus]|uniref:hypothetical protein n=1 Tax=Sandaracinus amylolyticus TaxID=927083 RepID=UPI001F38BD82|nr:hypothetical protein [Sandaracinus amylolyticus]UJR81508.1 Hypothetical protein I5071_35680 [Sandaracinus amylolyticus]
MSERRIVVVSWPESVGLGLRWAPLLRRGHRWHGCEVEYDVRGYTVYLRASTWHAPIDSPVRQWSHAELERELLALYGRVRSQGS